MTDLVTFGETMLRLSPPGDRRLERTADLDVHVGGAESNVAVTAQRLGVESAWISKLPDSPLGRQVTADLRSHGVDPDVVWSDEGRQGLYFLESGANPRGTDVIYDRADAAVTTAETGELPVERIRDADVFYTSGITPALSETLATTTAELLTEANAAGTTVAFDVNYRSKLWTPAEARGTIRDLLPAIDVLVVAERDAATVLERDGDPEAVATDLAAAYGLETAVITRGDEGALAAHDGAVYEQPVFEAGSPHPVGTGDAFVGALLARRLAGDDLPAALEYAAATAALKRTIPGDVASITSKEVERVIEEDAGGIDR